MNPKSNNPQSNDLFVYGTLRDATIQRQLLGRCFVGVPATLFGFRRIDHPTSYPFIERHAHGRVHGVLLCGLSALEMNILDAYEDEGRLYRRESVRVRVAASDRSAFAYVGIRAALRHVRRAHFDANRESLSQRP